MSEKILVVDDEAEIADLVELYLQNSGYQVLKFYDPALALEEIDNNLDMAILDIMMPGVDGLELCRRIREKYNYPVLLLTAKVEDIDKITGLSIGADDYITKPFNPLELVARVKAQMRRYKQYNEGEPKQQVFELRGLMIDRDRHECRLNNKIINLTPIEFDILWLLAENHGRVLSPEEIFTTVWQEDFMDSNNTVMVHIRRLREKLGEQPRAPKFIKTVWGVGYKIESNH
jgi:two-component system response regulator VanR